MRRSADLIDDRLAPSSLHRDGGAFSFDIAANYERIPLSESDFAGRTFIREMGGCHAFRGQNPAIEDPVANGSCLKPPPEMGAGLGSLVGLSLVGAGDAVSGPLNR